MFVFELLNWINRVLTFDKPDDSTRSLKFESRYAIVLHEVPDGHPFIISFTILNLSLFSFITNYLLACRVLCTNKLHLARNLEEILQNEGEGLVLRKPGSEYLVGRSGLLFKLKVHHLLLSLLPFVEKLKYV